MAFVKQEEAIDVWDSDSDNNSEDNNSKKNEKVHVVLPLGFLDPLSPEERVLFRQNAALTGNSNNLFPPAPETVSQFPPAPETVSKCRDKTVIGDGSQCRDKTVIGDGSQCSDQTVMGDNDELLVKSCKQFWKAGEYEDSSIAAPHSSSLNDNVGMDHLRVHPMFLHSNATSHKWALGAFAELLDNALDETRNGATYVHIDVLRNNKDNSKILLVEDNGGGMTPDTMRQCMSLGYSMKRKLENTIGQYGNGFKTSTMRLGADVIVFSRCKGKNGRSPTQTIGMLSYTFLRKTGKEDIVVPMIDYEKRGEDWKMLVRSSPDDWKRNLETILQWSPYASEEDLLQQFKNLKDQGTHIVIYNLWEDDEGGMELDFDTDHEDIQIRGVNRDEKKIEMAKSYPNMTHFLTYRHSLRNYAAILYLRIPEGFRIILRGKDVVHHNLVDDMMLSQDVTYKPAATHDGIKKDQTMVALVTIGFVKDAKHHLDIQGFNVYHKNRLIKPFWRVWNAAGSDGRGVIGVLEANFVYPAHDKQGFERTIGLSRLEQRLIVFQKNFWCTNCHLIGYAKRRHTKSDASGRSSSPIELDDVSRTSEEDNDVETGKVYYEASTRKRKNQQKSKCTSSTSEDAPRHQSGSNLKSVKTSRHLSMQTPPAKRARIIGDADQGHADSTSNMQLQLKEESRALKERVEHTDISLAAELLRELEQERERNIELQNKLNETKEKLKEMDKDHEDIVTVLADERERRDKLEESLRMQLMGASATIEDLKSQLKLLEDRLLQNCKNEN